MQLYASWRTPTRRWHCLSVSSCISVILPMFFLYSCLSSKMFFRGWVSVSVSRAVTSEASAVRWLSSVPCCQTDQRYSQRRNAAIDGLVDTVCSSVRWENLHFRMSEKVVLWERKISVVLPKVEGFGPRRLHATLCRRRAKAEEKISDISEPVRPISFPKDMMITPCSPELCVNISSLSGKGLEGLRWDPSM